MFSVCARVYEGGGGGALKNRHTHFNMSTMSQTEFSNLNLDSSANSLKQCKTLEA